MYVYPALMTHIVSSQDKIAWEERRKWRPTRHVRDGNLASVHVNSRSTIAGQQYLSILSYLCPLNMNNSHCNNCCQSLSKAPAQGEERSEECSSTLGQKFDNIDVHVPFWSCAENLTMSSRFIYSLSREQAHKKIDVPEGDDTCWGETAHESSWGKAWYKIEEIPQDFAGLCVCRAGFAVSSNLTHEEDGLRIHATLICQPAYQDNVSNILACLSFLIWLDFKPRSSDNRKRVVWTRTAI